MLGFGPALLVFFGAFDMGQLGAVVGLVVGFVRAKVPLSIVVGFDPRIRQDHVAGVQREVSGHFCDGLPNNFGHPNSGARGCRRCRLDRHSPLPDTAAVRAAELGPLG